MACRDVDDASAYCDLSSAISYGDAVTSTAYHVPQQDICALLSCNRDLRRTCESIVLPKHTTSGHDTKALHRLDGTCGAFRSWSSYESLYQ